MIYHQSCNVVRNILSAIGVVAIVLVLTLAAPAQEVTLTVADQNPPTSWGSVHAMQPWIRKIEEATRGRVKIEHYPGQTLVKGTETWNAVRAGIVDIGWCFHGYWPDITPLSDVITLPGLPIASAEKGSEVLWKLYEKFPAMRKQYAEIQPLALWTSHPYFLLTTSKQVKTLDDLNGLKIRVTGGPPTEQMKALGAVPTLVPMPDVYQALDKGVVDGMGAPWEAVNAFRLYEVAKYYTIAPLSAVYGSLCANKQKWESLPTDIRDAIMSVSGLEGSKLWGRNFFDAAEQAALDRAEAENREMIGYAMPTEEVARWNKIAAQPLWDAWVRKMEAKGHGEARQILEATVEMLND